MIVQVDLSGWAAFYAAIVATLALSLEVRRWFESGVVLRATYMADTITYPRGDGRRYIAVTVANRGNAPTTLTHFVLEVYPTWWRRVLRKPKQNLLIPAPTMGMPWPAKLEPGSHVVLIAQKTEEVERLLREKALEACLYGTHDDKPLRMRLKPPREIKGRTIGEESS